MKRAYAEDELLLIGRGLGTSPELQNSPQLKAYAAGVMGPSDAPKWPCPGEQAVPDDIYYPAALHCAQIETEEANRQKREALQLAIRMSKHAIVYQVLALLGWAAVVVMGVWG